MVEQFGFTKLLVSDLEAAATFYKNVFSFTEMARVESTINGRKISEIMFNPQHPGGATFVLLKFTDVEKPSVDEVILGFISTDLEMTLAQIEASGGRITQPLKTMAEHGIKVAFATDPEGHLLEIVELLQPPLN